jgi:polyisoprenoid-binding protein YceI
MKRPIFAAAIALTLAAGGAWTALAQPAAAPPRPAGGMPAMPPVEKDPAKLPAGHWVNDPRHSFLIMSVHHMGLSHPTFRMNKVDAAFDYDPAHPEASKVTATIDANSFDFGDAAISTQFAKEFLDAPAHPTITFTSTSIKKTGPDKGVMTGDLTLKGVTKPVTLDVTYYGFLNAMGGRAGFAARGDVKRSDFGPNPMPPAILSDEVEIHLELEFVKKG